LDLIPAVLRRLRLLLLQLLLRRLLWLWLRLCLWRTAERCKVVSHRQGACTTLQLVPSGATTCGS